MPGVRSIAMKSIRTTILTLTSPFRKEIGEGPPFTKNYFIHPRNFFKN